ncbi:MAG TPA: DUF167 domain-containing protein [bacterium]|nr:DUF167 domain-containing protein [bacterium]
MPIEITESKKGLGFDVKVRPCSGKSGIAGEQDGALRVDLKAQPEGGKANRELVKLLSRWLKVPAENVEIVSGASSRRKRVRATGVARENLDELLKNF